jgi:hypothetical protein
MFTLSFSGLTIAFDFKTVVGERFICSCSYTINFYVSQKIDENTSARVCNRMKTRGRRTNGF